MTSRARTTTPFVPKKVTTKNAVAAPKRNTKRDNDQFYTYLHRVLKQVHPDQGIDKSAIEMVNQFCIRMLWLICGRMQHFMMMDHRQTANSRVVMYAVRSVVPGELAKHAVSELTKAITKYNNKDTNAKGAKGERKERKCGLAFPVGRIEGMMRKNIKGRITETAPIGMAAVLEYLSAEILELAGNAARDFKRARVNRRCIMLALMNDQEFVDLIEGNKMTIPGGVIPNIRPELLPTKKAKKQ